MDDECVGYSRNLLEMDKEEEEGTGRYHDAALAVLAPAPVRSERHSRQARDEKPQGMPLQVTVWFHG